MMGQGANENIEDPKLRGLCRVGGWSALIVGTLLAVEVIVYITSSAPSLADTAGWFSLFQRNRLLGILNFGILETIALLLFVPIFLALYAALRQASESTMSIAAILAFIAIAVNFATGKLFSLLSLSDLYAAATTDAQRSVFLAAGQAALAQSAQGGIGGAVEGGIPLAVAGLLISAVMLRSQIFGKLTGYVGILANGSGLAMYVRAAAATAFEGSPFFAAFFLLSVVWFFLLGRKLLHAGRSS